MGEKETGLEWLQRSIVSREKRAEIDGFPKTYILISNVLIDCVKTQFNSIKQLLEMVLCLNFVIIIDINFFFFHSKRVWHLDLKFSSN